MISASVLVSGDVAGVAVAAAVIQAPAYGFELAG
jgi:hypothetical protein